MIVVPPRSPGYSTDRAMYRIFVVNFIYIYCIGQLVDLLLRSRLGAIIEGGTHLLLRVYLVSLAELPAGSVRALSGERACSSTVEHRCYTAEAGGSIPTRAHHHAMIFFASALPSTWGVRGYKPTRGKSATVRRRVSSSRTRGRTEQAIKQPGLLGSQ